VNVTPSAIPEPSMFVPVGASILMLVLTLKRHRRVQHRGCALITSMGFDQYHEPPSELSEEVRTFARMITSVIEEAEAISWYEQRIAIEKDAEAKAIMQNAQQEEFKHFGMDLEFLLRKKPIWRQILQGILFQPGDIVENGEKAEDEAK
ncbi:MAG TPA: hypothetical protein VEX68_20675, partial [Bryobacteraceae bacterium]|nr:hypothetical protein [Bryobacteraceae bacterium]